MTQSLAIYLPILDNSHKCNIIICGLFVSGFSSSECIRVVAYISTFLLFTVKYYCIVWTYYILYIHHLWDSCFYFLPLKNKLLWTLATLCGHSFSFLFSMYFRVNLLGHIHNCCNFEEVPDCFLKQLKYFTFPSTV